MLILFESKSGATEQYAKWLHEEFPESKLERTSEFPPQELADYKLIIYATPTYGGQLATKEYLETNWEYMKDSKVFLLVVGMVPQEESWSIRSYNTIKKEIRDDLAGYKKIRGVTENEAKGCSAILSKLILRVDPEKIKLQSHVQRQDLQPVVDWIDNNR
jgi:flavodoxin